MRDIESPRSAEWKYDRANDAIIWSEGLRHIADLGLGAEKLSLKEYSRHIHPDDRKRFMSSIEGATDGLLEIEYRLIDAGGSERSVHQLALVSKGRKGASSSIHGVLRDVTDLKSAEKEASESRKRLVALEEETMAVRKDLQDFTYHSSHDLHAPLRSIIGFSEIVLEDYSDKLDDQGKEHLRRVVAQAKHMGEMLNDLLKLSRVMTHPVNWQRVDLTLAASRIAGRLAETAPNRAYDFSIEKDLACQGDRELLEMALGCLLDNASKFSSACPVTKIEFGKKTIDREERFFVRDNGVGFDMAYKACLFLPFQRLHSSKEFDGNGMGLAIASAAIQKHGGRMWAESTEDDGATFYFVVGEAPRLPDEVS